MYLLTLKLAYFKEWQLASYQLYIYHE